ncbi:unnamed protein product [Effrenium voratum]|nr:unnamed protein product [Effrenium voratum]
MPRSAAHPCQICTRSRTATLVTSRMRGILCRRSTSSLTTSSRIAPCSTPRTRRRPSTSATQRRCARAAPCPCGPGGW